MRKVPFAERLMSFYAGADRAATIYGDLEELALTRGRLWFWWTYLRTLVSLPNWRSGFGAFVLAVMFKLDLFGPAFGYLMRSRVTHLSDPGLFGMDNHHVAIVCWNISLVIAPFLVFLLPFVLLRFGLRDRMTQLVCALFLIAMPAYSLRPWFMDLSGVLTLAVIAAAFALSAWRRPMLILAATFLTASVTVIAWVYALVAIFHRHFEAVVITRRPAVDYAAFAIATMVCIYLHRRMVDPRPLPIRPPGPMKVVCSK
jgi:hypothetical protein